MRIRRRKSQVRVSRYKNWRYRSIGWKQPKPGTITGEEIKDQNRSNQRRIFTRVCILICLLLFAEAAFVKLETGFWYLFGTWSLALTSAVYFIWVVVNTPFRTSKRFTLNPLRLFCDTIVSGAFMIFVFALFYRHFGTDPTGSALDNVYFSAVTFSTLGFGDIGPKPFSQGFAALEAMVGNLHLGFLVGATFAAITTNLTK